MNNKPTIEILSEKARLPADKEQTIDVLVRITPPPVDENKSRRPRLNLSMVLDRSGSMQGRKIVEARQAASYCIDQLVAADRISAVTFDDQIDILIPSQPVENKELLKRAINSIQVNGSTALHEAWVRGGLQVSEHLNTDAINRVLLITDGQANVGETNVDRIVAQVRELAAKGVSTSTIGIGEDFNEDLLMPMAEAGQGNAWHVQEPNDMVKIFETELRGLISQIGHSAALSIEAANGFVITDVLNDFETHGNGRYKLPNIRAGSPLDVVVRIHMQAQRVGTHGSIATMTLGYVDQETGLPVSIRTELSAEFALWEAIEVLPENAEVAKAVMLLMNARARREAMERMDRNDHAGSIDILMCAAESTRALSARVGSSELVSEADELNDIEGSLKDPAKLTMARKRMAYGSDAIRKGK